MSASPVTIAFSLAALLLPFTDTSSKRMQPRLVLKILQIKQKRWLHSHDFAAGLFNHGNRALSHIQWQGTGFSKRRIDMNTDNDCGCRQLSGFVVTHLVP
jgi:hypothetical protein